jgi:adenine-specific DNA-methyltransferase
MKGFVSTPPELVDRMVEKLFDGRPPESTDVVLDPGCGRGEFIAGILRWCDRKQLTGPTIVGVENDPRYWGPAHGRFLGDKRVKIRRRDFLKPDPIKYDFIIGNPPYVPITGLTTEERSRYREAGFATANGRMDLYLLFFEAALGRLMENGRLVFVTPEKFLYVETAVPLRKIMAPLNVQEIELLPEDSFPGLTTYPAITTLSNQPSHGFTNFVQRGGARSRGSLPLDGSSWLPSLIGFRARPRWPTLADVSIRISAGIATGADKIFVVPSRSLREELTPFAYPTISGRELKPGRPLPTPSHSMLMPYSTSGKLQSPVEASKLLEYLGEPERRARLDSRTCAQRKPWYAFHDSAPLSDIQRPKVVWKDISEGPAFWIDRLGTLIPRHSVYYLVPKDPAKLDEIAAYLASDQAKGWMRAHCQRAANGFLRLQSNILREMPIPPGLAAGEKFDRRASSSR